MTAHPLETTALLIQRFQQGESSARELLIARCLPALRRWAHGRLPAWGRDLSETDDLVQITLMRAVQHLDTFHPEREGAFLAYLRQILTNALRDEIRRSQRHEQEALEDDLVDPKSVAPTPFTGPEAQLAYEAALATLDDRQRQAVVLRVEFGLTFPEVAAELGIPSANAARMQVSRGLVKIAEAMARR